jgi:hypothetical protein
VWNQTRTTLANGRPDNPLELTILLEDVLCQLSATQSKLRWCFHHSDLPPFVCPSRCITYAGCNNKSPSSPGPPARSGSPSLRRAIFSAVVMPSLRPGWLMKSEQLHRIPAVGGMPIN